jgi:hypothetical protein
MITFVYMGNTDTPLLRWLNRLDTGLRVPVALCLTASSLLGHGVAAETPAIEGRLLAFDLSHARTARVSVGQHFLVRSTTFPLVPENLTKTFQVVFDTERLQLIADKPLGTEGRIGKQYQFIAKESGRTRIIILVRDHDLVIDSTALDLTAE